MKKNKGKEYLSEFAKDLKNPDVEMKVIALGMGMQSTALYMMSSLGDFERADVAIFSDPMAEHQKTYELLEWLLDWQKKNDGIPIEVVSTNLYQDILNGVNKNGYPFVQIPAFGKGKMIKRQCTYDYKIEPVEKKVRELYGLKKHKRMPVTEMWLGITIDEAQRFKLSRKPRIVNRYPFLELMMNRGDCRAYMENNGFPIPIKSACVFCPFHSDAQWKDIKMNYPEEWKKCVEIDNAIRMTAFEGGMSEPVYLHQSLKPLEEVDLQEDQIDMFNDECEGHCGL
jgi:hypothetical protein